MKKYLFIAIISVTLFAALGFWGKVLEIENKFYTIAPDLNSSSNVLASQKKEQDASSLVDARVKAFNELISLLKTRPYEVKKEKNPFYDPNNAQMLMANLKSRIALNQEYGYTAAVNRDEIALKALETKAHIYNFFVNLSQNWTDIDNKQLHLLITDDQKWLQTIDIAAFLKAYESVKGQTNTLAQQIEENYRLLHTQSAFFKDFLSYLDSNPSLLHYKSLTALFKLDEITGKINSIAIFAKINTSLRYIHLDMGRLVIFIMIMLFSWGASFILYYRLYGFLKKLILKKKDQIDDLLLDNLNGMRRPIVILVVGFGFELGLEVLLYPSILPSNVAIVFYIAYVALITYLITILTDSVFSNYMLKYSEMKDSQPRRELVNLIISISKITVATIAIFLILVRMGVNITGLLASLGVGGLAVALAAQSTLGNFFGLMKIISDNSFSQGDWIKTKDVEGNVVEIGFISTIIRTFDNALITVPNATLANAALKNWSKRTVGRRIKMKIGVTYKSDRDNLQHALQEIEDMLIEHPGVAMDKKVDQEVLQMYSKRNKKLVSTEDKYGVKTTLLVYLDEFSDSSIDILIYAFSKSVNWKDWLEVKQDVLFKVWQILEKNNLEFAFPSESLYFDRENIKDCFDN